MATRLFLKLAFIGVAGSSVLASAALSKPAPQEAQGEVIGTIEGPAIALKGPMSAQVVGNEVKTLLRSGVDVRVKSGRARIDLTEGGSIAVCGPAHISMLKTGHALTIALDSGTIHAHIEGNLTLNIFTAQIVAKPIAIGDGPQDVLVGFDTPGVMCVRAGRGAVRLEEQFGSQNVVVPQGGDVVLANGQLEGMRSSGAQCACESDLPEVSMLASSEEVKKSAAAKKAAQAKAPPAEDEAGQPNGEPTYQVFMPPLRFDASQKVQDEPDPRLIVLVRRVRVRPTLIYEGRVDGDPPAAKSSSLNATAATKPETTPAAKPAAPPNGSVVDRVKSFFKSLWTSGS